MAQASAIASRSVVGRKGTGGPQGALRARLIGWVRRGIEACHPETAIRREVARLFPDPPGGRTYVFGAGKAAAQMAAAFEDAYPYSVEGFVVTRDGFETPTRKIEVMSASHPVPDARSLAAGERMMREMAGVDATDRVIFLLSGGASALLCATHEDLTLSRLQDLMRELLGSGLPISTMNTVRASVSAIKAGRLATYCPAPITTLAISDVPGDDPAFIGSAPTYGRAPKHRPQDIPPGRLPIWDEITKSLDVASSPTRTGSYTDRSQDDYVIIASSATCLRAVRDAVTADGIPIISDLGEAEGEAQSIASQHAALLAEAAARGETGLILSSGELTVTLEGCASPGKGGPNQEYMLALMDTLPSGISFSALAIDTDGIDGVGDVAGGAGDTEMLERARFRALDLTDYLDRHDSQAGLDLIGGLVRIGPTGTNVNDCRLLWVNPILDQGVPQT